MILQFEVDKKVWWETYKTMLDVGLTQQEIEVCDARDVYGFISKGDSVILDYECIVKAEGVTVTDDRIVRIFEKLKALINSGQVKILKAAQA